jgi:hypothetical protein
MDYSGSPTLFISENTKDHWKGFFNDQPDPDSKYFEPDTIINGKGHFISTVFDFDNPLTDYDRLCAIFEEQGEIPVVKFPNDSGPILSVSSFYDPVGWWPEENIFFNGKFHEIDMDYLHSQEWQPLTTWENHHSSVYIMNACCSLLDPNFLPDEDCQLIQMKSGTYAIEMIEYQLNYCSFLYRFNKL